jgi:hypothetical protein
VSRNLVALLESKLVQHTISATRPSGPSDGVDVTPWRTNGQFAGELAVVFIDGDQALSVSSPTGGSAGVELWGYRLSQWWLIGYLNDGTQISITGAAQGFAQQANVIGAFDRLAVAGTPSVGTVLAKFVPLDQWQTPA